MDSNGSYMGSTIRHFVTKSDTVVLIVLWKIWDARNAKVFRDIDQSSLVTITKIVDDLTLWLNRCKNITKKEHAGLWRDFLSSRLNLSSVRVRHRVSTQTVKPHGDQFHVRN